MPFQRRGRGSKDTAKCRRSLAGSSGLFTLQLLRRPRGGPGVRREGTENAHEIYAWQRCGLPCCMHAYMYVHTYIHGIHRKEGLVVAGWYVHIHVVHNMLLGSVATRLSLKTYCMFLGIGNLDGLWNVPVINCLALLFLLHVSPPFQEQVPSAPRLPRLKKKKKKKHAEPPNWQVLSKAKGGNYHHLLPRCYTCQSSPLEEVFMSVKSPSCVHMASRHPRIIY